MKIYKISGVEEFMSGVRISDLDQYPPENQLTEKQANEIRQKTLDSNSPRTKMEYFIKYPKHAYFTIWDLKDCIAWRTPEEKIQTVWKLMLKNSKLGWGVPTDLPDWIYQDITKNIRKLGINENTVGEIFLMKSGYPDFFIAFLAKNFPSLWQAANMRDPKKIKALLKKYLEFPNIVSYSALNVALDATEVDKSDSRNWKKLSPEQRQISFDIGRMVLDLDNLESKIKNVVRSKKNTFSGWDWERTGEDMRTVIVNVLESYQNNKEISSEDQPFSLFIDNSKSVGVIKTLWMGSFAIKPDLLNEIVKIISSDESQYWTLTWGIDPKRTMENYNIPDAPENLPREIYLITNGKYFNVGKRNKNYSVLSDIKDSSVDSQIELLSGIINLETKDRADILSNWLQEKAGAKNTTLDDHFYLSLAESKAAHDLTENAGRDIFGSVIQKHRTLTQEELNSGTKASFGMLVPFYMQEANKFWNKIPIKIRAASYKKVNLWYLCLSGLFPCDKVWECASESLYDLEKIANNLQCLGDSSKIREMAKAHLTDKKKDIQKRLKDKLPEFLASSSVKKFNITDFPEVYEFAVKMMKGNMANGSIYDHETGKYIPKSEQATRELQQCKIYFIDASAYNTFLGEDGRQISPSGPDKANGFFAPKYSEFGNDSCIVIFTNNLNTPNIGARIMDELGISSMSEGVNFSEENTLWHEVAHAFLEQVQPGAGRDVEEIKDESEWLSSPSEIAAMNYGNLQHIKIRIKQYFDKIFPFPVRITQGFLEQIKSDIIDTFAWEFQGVHKQEALATINEAMPEFNEESLGMMNQMSKEEQVKVMTNMFTEFFMRKFTRSKIEDDINTQLSDSGKSKEKVEFGEEPIVADPYVSIPLGGMDKFIQELERRSDYQTFMQSCQEIVSMAYSRNNKESLIRYWRPYVNRFSPESLRKPNNLEGLLLFMFGTPATIQAVNLEELNPVFSDVIPESLMSEVKKIVINERKIRGAYTKEIKPTPVSPQEAEDAGQFMTEMEQDYGPDWIWTADSNTNWYKKAKRKDSLCLAQTSSIMYQWQ